ncbi:formylglycine-generating enzyme family protein [Azospirillum halopraeferens]|uniref:formylglycine-generating enzyme family protein n=1 Tax=Azospirillum halopraeferens TaxID=34010 RepID=UPI0012EB9E50|nr:SUMF1/EgtB/PvdO family nonheme iron enzyme [Azospirillum halopraeferens]
MKHACFALAALWALPAAAETITWDKKMFDPAGGADLVLPMPCGGAMAFQRVITPVAPDDPLADRRVHLGVGQPETGYADYTRLDHLRGGFTDAGKGETWFYIARYELTRQQAKALRGDCAPPDQRGIAPETGMSWYDAVDLSRRFSEWLRQKAPESLPKEEGVPGFIRLPTETEWEYAARGGAKVSPTEFQGRRYPMTGALRDHAWHQGADSARGQFRPVGRLAPNPLGLYDIYGNAEELILEPFRINNVGRLGGQAGGVLTRGGSIFSDAEAIYSAQRQEWSPFDAATGKAQAQDTFGARFVLATHVTLTLERINNIRSIWIARSSANPDVEIDPLRRITGLIDDETQPERRASLEAVRGDFVSAERLRNEARLEALKATLFGGAVLIAALMDIEDQLVRISKLLKEMETAKAESLAANDANDVAFYTEQVDVIKGRITTFRESRKLSVLSFERQLVAAASPDHAAILRRQARDVLDLELATAGLTNMRPLVQRFASVADTYAARPDRSIDDMVRSAILP